MKRKTLYVSLVILFVITSVTCTDARGQKQILNIPIIFQNGKIDEKSIQNLCALYCAEMILKFYGINNIKGVDIAETLCTKLNPAYNIKMVYDEEEKIRFSTNCEGSLSTGIKYPGTNGPVLRQYFKGLGFKTIRRRTKYNKENGKIPVERFEEFMGYVYKGIPVIIHVEGHYMLVVGYNDAKYLLYINDPSYKKRIIVDYARFQNRDKRWIPRRRHNPGWDGRFIAVWK